MRDTWWLIRQIEPRSAKLLLCPTQEAAEFWQRECFTGFITDIIPVEVLLEPLIEVKL